ncbi:MAG: ATP-binding cassette domain-containing protein [Azospirillaceae bacterium]|nr:ATP-binding cassette domain-containing protein [Azospirillaceae bacterium]
MTAAPLLEIRGMTHDYAGRAGFGRGPALRALDNVSLSIDAGTIFGLVGESGCGKSTLARLVMALDRPSAGTVRFDGEDLFALSAAALKRKRRAFQMVFQDPFGSLDPRQTVERIVAEPLHVLETRPSRDEQRERVAAMLDSVGLHRDAATLYPHQFSGGQRQRIAIARALITEPRLVVADEAVSALDLSVQAQVLNLLLDLRETRGVTFLFISHNLGAVDCIADRIGVMYRGRLVESGPAHAVFEHPHHPYTRLLLEAEPDIARIGPPPHRSQPQTRSLSPPAVGVPSPACAFAPRCPLVTDRCRIERPELRTLVPGRDVACHHAETMRAAFSRPTQPDAEFVP